MTRRYLRKLARRMTVTRRAPEVGRQPPEPIYDPLAVVVGLAMAAVLVTVWGMP